MTGTGHRYFEINTLINDQCPQLTFHELQPPVVYHAILNICSENYSFQQHIYAYNA